MKYVTKNNQFVRSLAVASLKKVTFVLPQFQIKTLQYDI
jgi:hypothetical protein